MQISLNKIDPNVLGQFRYNVLDDDSLVLVRFDSEKPPYVSFKSGEADYPGSQSFGFVVYPEDRTINCIIQISRTSSNWYVIMASDKTRTQFKRVSTVQAVSDFIKVNYCRTLMQLEQENK